MDYLQIWGQIYLNKGRMMEIHLAHKLRSLNLAEVIMFYKLKLSIYQPFASTQLKVKEGHPRQAKTRENEC